MGEHDLTGFLRQYEILSNFKSAKKGMVLLENMKRSSDPPVDYFCEIKELFRFSGGKV